MNTAHPSFLRAFSTVLPRAVAAVVSTATLVVALSLVPAQDDEPRTAGASAPAPAVRSTSHPRLIVTTDIGGDPDDTQSLIRLLLWSNEIEIEALIASASGTPGELKRAVVRPDLIRGIIEAYGAVRENLARHDPSYPEATTLLERIHAGNPQRGVSSLGEDHDTDGSRAIIEIVDQRDSRPVDIAIWGGSTELAQALWRVRKDRSPEELGRFIAKLRVHAIGHQDDTGPWIISEFPELFYVLSMAPEGKDKREGAYRGMYLGGDESLTSREWLREHVLEGHGPLGALYPTRTWTAPNPHSALKEGDTPSWFYFLRNGLQDPEHPSWGGWGGRFERESGKLFRDAADTVDGETHPRDSVSRWRPAFQAHFRARLDACVRPPAETNHAPRAVLNDDRGLGILSLDASPGDEVELSAAGSSDPDGDSWKARWWIYPEASSLRTARLSVETGERTSLIVPKDASSGAVHVILEVTDGGDPPLPSYRRAVVWASTD